MLAKFGTNSGGITWWSNFELIQVEPHTIGQIWNQCNWHSISRAGEITQVIDSIPWVRCASGNVYYKDTFVAKFCWQDLLTFPPIFLGLKIVSCIFSHIGCMDVRGCQKSLHYKHMMIITAKIVVPTLRQPA